MLAKLVAVAVFALRHLAHLLSVERGLGLTTMMSRYGVGKKTATTDDNNPVLTRTQSP